MGPDGIITTVVGGGTAPVTNGALATALALHIPTGLAVDLTGSLFVADIGLGWILEVSPSGTISRVLQKSSWRLAVDSAGNLFYEDNDTNQIRKISPDRKTTTVAGNSATGFSGDGGSALKAKLSSDIGGLAIDPAGNLYIADNGNNRIRKLIGVAAPGVIGGQ